MGGYKEERKLVWILDGSDLIGLSLEDMMKSGGIGIFLKGRREHAAANELKGTFFEFRVVEQRTTNGKLKSLVDRTAYVQFGLQGKCVSSAIPIKNNDYKNLIFEYSGDKHLI